MKQKRQYNWSMNKKIGLAVFSVFCATAPLPADDLSVLGYGLVFWPAAFVFILVLLILSLFNLRALWKKIRNRAASIRATFTLLWATAGMVGFPLVLEGNRFRQLTRISH